MEPEVIEIPPPIFRTSKFLKQKQVSITQTNFLFSQILAPLFLSITRFYFAHSYMIQDSALKKKKKKLHFQVLIYSFFVSAIDHTEIIIIIFFLLW